MFVCLMGDPRRRRLEPKWLRMRTQSPSIQSNVNLLSKTITATRSTCLNQSPKLQSINFLPHRVSSSRRRIAVVHDSASAPRTRSPRTATVPVKRQSEPKLTSAVSSSRKHVVAVEARNESSAKPQPRESQVEDEGRSAIHARGTAARAMMRDAKRSATANSGSVSMKENAISKSAKARRARSATARTSIRK